MLTQMKTRAAALTTLVLLLAPTAALAIGGSGSHYETEQDGSMEFYENGQPKSMKNGATCTGVKVVVQPVPVPSTPQGVEQRGGNPQSSQQATSRKVAIGGAAYGHIAFQVPIDATIASLETFTDATLSTPLLIMGELAVWSPNAAVAAEAEAFAGPAQPGFAWRGFRTNALLETISGRFEQPFHWVVSFDPGGYPAPGMIGTHDVAVYVSDNAEDPDPLLEWHTVY